MVSGISVENTPTPLLTYEYLNEPKSGALETLSPHRGTIWFDIDATSTRLRLSGDYYTGRGRGTTGRIEVERARGDNGEP